jgi:deoxyadenosine/deoxycytidine kinase
MLKTSINITMVYTVCIDGIIGCGKSSLMTRLSGDFTCFQEPVHEWSLLQNFYEDMTTYAAPFQYQVLFSFHKLFSTFKNIKDIVIMERCPWSSKNIFTEMLVEAGHIQPLEYEIYSSFYDKIAFTTDLFIYLKVDTAVAYQRILQRDRAAERSLKLDYLQLLNNKYNKEIATLKNVYIIDANQPLNKVKSEVENILKNI